MCFCSLCQYGSPYHIETTDRHSNPCEVEMKQFNEVMERPVKSETDNIKEFLSVRNSKNGDIRDN